MKRPFRGWAVCVGCALSLFICCGLLVNAYNVAQPYILEKNGFTNTQTSTITTIRAVVNVGCIFLVPLFYRKTGYRLGLTIATALSATASILFAFAKSLPMYFFAAAVAGLGYGFGCTIPVSIVLSRWFHARRGLAMGICTGATGLATVIFSPVLSRLIENFGLKTCFLLEAGFCALVTVLVFLLIRDDPADCGLEPYGSEQETSRKKLTGTSVELAQVWWVLIVFAAVLMGSYTTVGFSHITVLLTTAGFTPIQASTAISIFGLFLLAGKLIFGVIIDRYGCYRTNYALGGLLLISLALCMTANLRSLVLVYAASAIYGLGCPVSSLGLSLWSSDFSSPETYPKALQKLQLGYAIGALLFGTMPGMIADRFGSYVPSYGVQVLFCLVSFAIIQITYLHIAKTEGRKL